MEGIFDRITGREPVQPGDEEAVDTTLVESFDDEGGLSADELAQTDAAEMHRTERRLREASQELLRFGLLEESHKPNLYKIATRELAALNAILEPFDLIAEVDEVRGLVFLKVLKRDTASDPDEEWSHPLVRKQRLTLEQSLLVAILRQYFIAYEQEAGTGASQAMVAVDELIPQMQVYLGEQGSEARERTRMLNLLDQLKDHGLVSAPDKNERVMIRPIIAHLANPENLQVLLNWLRERVAEGSNSTEQENEE